MVQKKARLWTGQFFLIVLIVTVVIILFIMGCNSFHQNKDSLQTRPAMNTNVSIIHYIYDKNALFPSILIFFLCITFAGIFSFIDGLGAETGLGANISIFFLVFMAMLLFIRPFSGILFDRYGHKILIYPAGLCGIIGLLLLAGSTTLSLLCLAAFFYGLGNYKNLCCG